MGAAIRVMGFVVLALACAWPSAASAQSAVDRYRTLLAPHGAWVSAAPYGEVFVPREAGAPDFEPYLSAGRWAQGEQGLVFESSYAWGAVCFHHGRWARPDGLDTWAWVPDASWGPAWVEWRRRGGDVAWAPMRPSSDRSPTRWYVAPLGSLGAADLAARALRVSVDAVASFAPMGATSPDGEREASTSVPRGQVMLSGGGRIVVHERGGDRVLEVAPVIVPRGSAEEREARRREELAREREAARARERELAAARVAAAPAPTATATATASVTVTAPAAPAPVGGTAWTLGYGYGPYGWGYGPYGAAAPPASAPVQRDPYSPPRFSAPRLPFGAWRE